MMYFYSSLTFLFRLKISGSAPETLHSCIQYLKTLDRCTSCITFPSEQMSRAACPAHIFVIPHMIFCHVSSAFSFFTGSFRHVSSASHFHTAKALQSCPINWTLLYSTVHYKLHPLPAQDNGRFPVPVIWKDPGTQPHCCGLFHLRSFPVLPHSE